MGIFVAAVFFLLITPGPGVLSTAGVGAAYGRRAGHRYVAGLCLGTNLVALAVVTGVAALILAQPVLRTVLLLTSIAYLLWLALRIAYAGNGIAFIGSDTAPGFRDGLALQAINPKAYVVNTALFTGFPFEGLSLPLETFWKFVVINAIWVPIHLAWLAAGIALQRLQLSPQRQRLVNAGMALALISVVMLALFSSGISPSRAD